MGVDLHRIGFGISSGISRNGFGNIVSFNQPVITCPALGTLLRTADTSRYENDILNQPFWMPYTTSFYADGSCGETSSEVWGLQYLPAGWVTGSSIIDIYVNPYGSNYYLIGQDEVRSTEDGTGINTTMPYGSVYRDPFGTWLAWVENTSPFQVQQSYINGFNGQVVYVNAGYYLQNAYLCDGSNGWFTGNYIYSGQPYAAGTYVADQPDYMVEVPNSSSNEFANGIDLISQWDGAGNIENSSLNSVYANGTFIYEYQGSNYYWDGSGGYYGVAIDYGYPAYGTELIAEQSGNYTISTDCGQMVVGDWYDDADYADGNGGYYNNGTSYSNYAINGTQVGNCNGNNYFSDGNGSYYTEEDGTGGGCPSSGSFIGGPFFADSFLTTQCGDFYLGSYIFNQYADGSCSSYDSIETPFPLPYGTYVGSCDGNVYFSDGNLGSYSL